MDGKHTGKARAGLRKYFKKAKSYLRDILPMTLGKNNNKNNTKHSNDNNGNAMTMIIIVIVLNAIGL